MNKSERDAAHKFKQDWIESVMADHTATPAIKVYAFGVYKHMYGTKTESFPGAKAIMKATGLDDGRFYKYNAWLERSGYLVIDRRPGTHNTYRLALPTARGGNTPRQRRD